MEGDVSTYLTNGELKGAEGNPKVPKLIFNPLGNE